MPDAPSVLLLDDGELKRVRGALVRLGVDFVHLQGAVIGEVVPRPRDLLLTTCRRALELPRLESVGNEPAEPVWVCVHNQDFIPLRERLRGLGVHFLVHSTIDAESLRLLLGQLLHAGAEQRGTLRLPFGCQVAYGVGLEHRKAVLADLSADGCRIISTEDVPAGTSITIDLPRELVGGARVELPGRALRSGAYEPRSQAPGFSVVIAFDHLESEARAYLEGILDGRQLGAPVAPLEPAPGHAIAPEPEILLVEEAERRRHLRRDYRRRVTALIPCNADAAQVVLGHDLSLVGIHIESRPGLEVGSRTALALYGRSREEPVIVEACVVRDDGARGLGLQFDSMTPEQTQQLERLIEQLPPLESLQEGDPEGERLVVSRLIPPPR
jgi:hypothetical protein